MRGWITAGPGARDRVAWAPEICEILDNQTDHAIAGQSPKEQTKRSTSGWVTDTTSAWVTDIMWGWQQRVMLTARLVR